MNTKENKREEKHEKAKKMTRDIFISHRHDDAEIAKVIKKNLEQWAVPSERIFLSSESTSSTMIGEPLDEGVKKALHEARILFFLYTSEKSDWIWCVYEIGLATDPTVATRIVVLKCTDDDLPSIVKGQVVVQMTEVDIKKLVWQFHKEEGFFPGQPAYAETVADSVVEERGVQLFKELKEVIPTESDRTIIRWGGFTLRIGPEITKFLRKVESLKGLSRETINKVKCESEVVSVAGWGIQHFGFQDFTPGYKLKELADRWSKEVDMESDKDAWIKELCEEMWKCITNRSPSLKWQPLRSLRNENLWICPVVCQARQLSNGSMEFDVYTFQVPAPAGKIKKGK